MLAFVRVAAARLREGLAADPALVGLLTGVRQLVLLEAGHLGKPLAATLELAGVWALARVRPDVVLEVPGSGEGLGALCVRTDKGPLARVDAPVNVEVLRSVEPLPAAWELTLARPVRNVDLLDVRAEVGGERERASTAGVVALVRLVLLLLDHFAGPLQLHVAVSPRRVYLRSFRGHDREAVSWGEI